MPQTARYHSDQIKVLTSTIYDFFGEEYDFDLNKDSDFEAEVNVCVFARIIEHVVNTGQKSGTSWIAPFVNKIAQYCKANEITSWSERLDLLVKSNEMSQCRFPVESIRSEVIKTLTEFKRIFSVLDEVLKDAEQI